MLTRKRKYASSLEDSKADFTFRLQNNNDDRDNMKLKDQSMYLNLNKPEFLRSEYFRYESSPSTCNNLVKAESLRCSNSTFKNEKVEKLGSSFFNSSCIDLAKRLLGQIMVRRLSNGVILRGRIVETESYLGGDDKASHSYQGKRTIRNAAMFMKPGTAYVYSIYGMYYCFNISSDGDGAAVLVRALEPLEGIDLMKMYRGFKRKDKGQLLKLKDLCNGPSKLCQAFQINKDELNTEDLTNSNVLWLEKDTSISECDIVQCKRIGIDGAGKDWADKPLRFYIKSDVYVSVRNKMAEFSTVSNTVMVNDTEHG